MLKLINKFIFHLKNLVLPILLFVTIYIVNFMFQRIGKNLLGENLLEFIEVILPFILLIILSVVNLVLKQEEVKTNTFYNVTSLLVVITIAIFCIRALFDGNMFFLHKYSYHINFNYFSDQIAATKVMLYGLSVGNILLMISGYIKIDEEKSTKKVETKKLQ